MKFRGGARAGKRRPGEINEIGTSELGCEKLYRYRPTSPATVEPERRVASLVIDRPKDISAGCIANSIKARPYQGHFAGAIDSDRRVFVHDPPGLITGRR